MRYYYIGGGPVCMIVESDRCTYASAISGKINFKSKLNCNFNTKYSLTNATSAVYFNKKRLPSGSLQHTLHTLYLQAALLHILL